MGKAEHVTGESGLELRQGHPRTGTPAVTCRLSDDGRVRTREPPREPGSSRTRLAPRPGGPGPPVRLRALADRGIAQSCWRRSRSGRSPDKGSPQRHRIGARCQTAFEAWGILARTRARGANLR